MACIAVHTNECSPKGTFLLLVPSGWYRLIPREHDDTLVEKNKGCTKDKIIKRV